MKTILTIDGWRKEVDMNEFLEGLTALATGVLDFFYYKSMVWIAWWFLMSLFQKKFLYKEALMMAAVGTVLYLFLGWIWYWIAEWTLHTGSWPITIIPWMVGLGLAALTIRFEFITFLGISEGMWSFKRPRYCAFFAKNAYVTADDCYAEDKKKSKWWRSSKRKSGGLFSVDGDYMPVDMRERHNYT